MSNSKPSFLSKLRSKFVDGGKDKKKSSANRDEGSKREETTRKKASMRERKRKTTRRTHQSTNEEELAKTAEEKPKTLDDEGSVRRKRTKSSDNVLRIKKTVQRKPPVNIVAPQPKTIQQAAPEEKPKPAVVVKPAVEPQPVDPFTIVCNDWAKALLDKGSQALMKEFTDLANEKIDSTAFNDPANADKNRYKNIPCIESSRVRLNEGGYIHANYVRVGSNSKRFICSQSPMDSTADAFWQMVVQEEVDTIVMISSLSDQGQKDQRKSAIHFPLMSNENHSLLYGSHRVTNLKKAPLAEEPSVVCYSLQVKSASVKREVKVFHVTFWPEQGGVPEITMATANLLGAIRSSKKPILFHCSTGCGRTGVFVYIEMLLEKLLAGQAESAIDVLKELRSQRFMAIQSELQFTFAIRSLLFYLMGRNFIEMAQSLLEFIDETDISMKKLAAEEKEKRDKRIADGAKETDLASWIENEFVPEEKLQPGVSPANATISEDTKIGKSPP